MGFAGAIISLAIFVALALAAIFVLYSVVLNFQPGRNKIKKDLEALRKLIAPTQEALIPLDNDELELMSYNQINRSKKSGLVKTHKGTFTSIYHEPIIDYAYRKYLSSKENALVVARTADREFMYRIKGDQVQIYLDGQELGVLKQDDGLYGGRKKKLLAKLDRNSHEEMMPVLIKGREVGMFTKPEKARAINPRAFGILKDMSEEEQLVLKSLVILEAVRKEM